MLTLTCQHVHNNKASISKLSRINVCCLSLVCQLRVCRYVGINLFDKFEIWPDEGTRGVIFMLSGDVRVCIKWKSKIYGIFDLKPLMWTLQERKSHRITKDVGFHWLITTCIVRPFLLIHLGDVDVICKIIETFDLLSGTHEKSGRSSKSSRIIVIAPLLTAGNTTATFH